jgi:hypothetical protein
MLLLGLVVMAREYLIEQLPVERTPERPRNTQMLAEPTRMAVSNEADEALATRWAIWLSRAFSPSLSGRLLLYQFSGISPVITVFTIKSLIAG